MCITSIFPYFPSTPSARNSRRKKNRNVFIMKEHKNAEWMIATLDRRRKSPRKKVELLEPVPETVVYKRRAPLKLLCSTPKQEKMNSSSETRENKSVINHLISFLCCSAFIGCVSSVHPHSYDFMLSSHCNAFKSLLLLFR